MFDHVTPLSVEKSTVTSPLKSRAFHVTSTTESTASVSPPLGYRSCRLGTIARTTVKLLSESSLTAPPITRTRYPVAGVRFSTQVNVPWFAGSAAAPAMSRQLAPPSLVYCSDTVGTSDAVHEMRIGSPEVNVSPPLGLSTRTDATGSMIEKVPDSANAGPPTSTMRILPLLVSVVGTVQVKRDWLAGMLDAIRCQVDPPLELYSMLTLPTRVAVQVIS